MELVSLCEFVFNIGCITAVYGLLEFKFVFPSNLGRVCKDGSMYCNDSFVYRAFDFDLLS